MNSSWKLSLAATVLAGLISGCGGGGAGAGAGSVTGVAATGAAIGGGTVTLKCVSGTSTAATTGSDGTFSIDVSSVTLPCVGRVDYKDGAGVAQKLHTFITAAGTANITPVTELMVASLTGGSPADAFDKFDATKVKALTPAQIKAAAAAVKAYLKTLGVDTANLPDDPVGTKFTPKVGSTPGDAADKVLDDLKAKLAAAGKTLAGAGGEVAKGGAGAGGAAGSAIGSGLYTGVTAKANTDFIALLGTACTTKAANPDGSALYGKCTQNSASFAVNLTANMWTGGLPFQTGGKIISGPSNLVSPGSNPKVTTVQSAAGVAVGDACTGVIDEPFIPFVTVEVKGARYFPTGVNFDFKGTVDDTVSLTASGVVSEFTMTNGAGGKLEMHPNLALFGGGLTGAEAAVTVSPGVYYICR